MGAKLFAATGTVTTAVATNAAATNTVAAAARTATRASAGQSYLGLAIWVAVILALFGFLWAKGYLIKIRNYVDETREELKKCSWPSREELKGSTVVVLLTTILLGLFTVGVDLILSKIIGLIT